MSKYSDACANNSFGKPAPEPKFEITGTCLLTGKQVKGSTSFDFDGMGFNSAGVRNALAGVTKSHARHTWVRTPL